MTTTPKEQKIDQILGRALRDRDFREKLSSDPKAAAEECGLSLEEMDLIAGGLAIGDSLLNPQTVAWCTNRTCAETGKRGKVLPPDIRVRTNPDRYRPNVRPDKFRPQVRPGVQQEAQDEPVQGELVIEDAEK